MKLDCRKERDILQLTASFSNEEMQQALDFMCQESKDVTLRLLDSARAIERAQGYLEILTALETQRMLNRMAI